MNRWAAACVKRSLRLVDAESKTEKQIPWRKRSSESDADAVR